MISLSLLPSSYLRNGIDFLVNQSGLKAGCFLAMEAVDWVMERVSGATTRAEAVRVLQVRWLTHTLSQAFQCYYIYNGHTYFVGCRCLCLSD